MKTLKEKADKLAIKYIKEFEKKYELYLESPVADDYFKKPSKKSPIPFLGR